MKDFIFLNRSLNVLEVMPVRCFVSFMLHAYTDGCLSQAVVLAKGLRCLISSGILYTYLNSSREQLRKTHQLYVLRQKSNLRLCDAGAMLLPLSYGGS